MKILFAIKGLDEAVGGAERVLCLVAGELARRGHGVSVVTYDRPGGRPYFVLNNDVRRLTLGIGRIDRRATLGETIRRIAALRRAVRAEAPDIVVGFMHSMFMPLGLALSGTALPVIASERCVATLYQDRRMEWALLHLAPLFTRRMTALSDQAKNTFPRVLRRSMVVIPNPVDLGRRTKADTAGGVRKTLLAVGRLTAQKDHRTLVEAFAMLAGEFPAWDLRIVGEGHLRPALEERIAARGLERRISLPGTTHDIASEYTRAQLYVMSSSYEGFPCATAEALAHGLPGVGFADCPGTNELIKDGTNGLLVAGRDRVRALADGLRTLMRDAGLRARQGAAAPATLTEFEPARIYDRWENLLMEHARPAAHPAKAKAAGNRETVPT